MWVFCFFSVVVVCVSVLIFLVCGGYVVDSIVLCEFFDFGDIFLCIVEGCFGEVCEVVCCMLFS